LNAAMKLFEQNGVEQVSMNQIANEAQIGPGTLYRRYRDKGELCLDLIRDSIDQLFEDIEGYLEQNRTEPPRQRLKGVLRLFIHFREMKAQLLKGVEDSAALSSKRYSNGTRSPIYDQLHEIIVKLFDEMTEVGQTRPNSVFRADMLLAALRSDSYSFQRDVRGYSPHEIEEQLYLTFFPE
jgi:AcrR family transcriptional regulator